MIALSIAAVAIILAIYLLLKFKHSYWNRKGVPQIKPFFLFGNFKDAVFGDTIPNAIVKEAYWKFKMDGVKHGGIYFMYTPIWIPIDPELIKSILFQDARYFTGHGYFYQHKNDTLTNHLFNAEGEKWKHLRAKLTPAFSNGKLKLMFDILDAVGDRLERKVKGLYGKSEPLNVKEVAACFGTDIIATCAFGLDCNSLEDPNVPFRKYGKQIFEPRILQEILEQLFNWDLLNFFGHSWLNKEVNEFFLGLVKDMINLRDKRQTIRHDFLHLLLQLRDKENFSFEDIAANVLVIYAAGYETTSTTMSYVMYELARHPKIQDKLRQEILKICPGDKKVTYDDLQQMKYCEMVVNETLRLHNTATETPRKCTKTYQIPGTDVKIEEGIFVLIPNWGLHTDPDYYPNPLEFDPENFSESSKASRHPNALFLPFGEGTRQCIGMRFAMMELKLAMVKCLRKFKYELNPATPKDVTYEANNVTMIPKGEILLDILEI
ncbi:unnamed protein product [Ceutorhynchus assimilis]|uniref:Cytochrome P450 n=1 Tax=Ceutorhynchus assimilis TaxID=467358 RepID=A0A9N9MF14_9CUCU|nr:unnamed protein product [Ceutorhynchus assimilis]